MLYNNPGMLKRQRKTRRLRSLLISSLVLAVIFGSLLVWFLSLPVWKIVRIEVSGNELLPDQLIIQTARVPIEENIFFLRSAAIARRLGQLSQIKYVRISKKLPGTVRLQIVEREPFAVLVFSNKSLVVDEKGYLAGEAKSLQANISALPVVRGVAPEQLSAEQKVESSAMLVIEKYLKLVRPFFETNRVQLEVSDQENLILMIDDVLEVRLGGSKDINEKIVILKILLNQIRDNWQGVEYIDVRSIENPVIKFKTG